MKRTIIVILTLLLLAIPVALLAADSRDGSPVWMYEQPRVSVTTQKDVTPTTLKVFIFVSPLQSPIAPPLWILPPVVRP